MKLQLQMPPCTTNVARKGTRLADYGYILRTIILWREPRNLVLNSFFSPQSVKLGSVTYKKLDNSADYLPVRRRVEEIIEQAQFSTHTFSDNKHVSKIE